MQLMFRATSRGTAESLSIACPSDCPDSLLFSSRRSFAGNERSLTSSYGRRFLSHGYPRSRKCSAITRVLGVELRVVHQGLILAIRIRRIFVLVDEVAQMIQKRCRDSR